MPENGSVGSAGGSGAASANAGASSSNSGSNDTSSADNNSSNDIGHSDNDSDNSTNSSSSSSNSSSATTAESIADSPTTADSLAGGQAAQPEAQTSDPFGSDDNDDNDNDNNNNAHDVAGKSAPEAGTGSLDAAVSHSQNVSAATQMQDSITPDTEPPSFDDEPEHKSEPKAGTGSLDAAVEYSQNLQAAKNANPNLGVETSESKTSAGSIAGSVVGGGLATGAAVVDKNGRAAAMDVLTNGNAGNLPAAGFANRTELAGQINHPTMKATDALDLTPFSEKAKSTQKLADTIGPVKTLSRAGNIVGNVVGPVIGTIEGFQAAPKEATTGEKIANAIGGGLKEADDALVSGLAGAGATVGTTFAAAGLAAGGVTAPAAPAVALSAPAVGTAAAIGASKMYDGNDLDEMIDNAIDDHVEPFVADVIDGAIDAKETAQSWGAGLADRVRSWF